MPRPGGESDKLGNQYEAMWTVDCAVDVILGRCDSVTAEAFGGDAQGVEFQVVDSGGCLEFHSVKRQKTGGDWSLNNLAKADPSTGRSILGDLILKRIAHPSCKPLFVSATGANELRELSERAKRANSFTEFESALSANLRRGFQGYVVPLVSGNPETAFDALAATEVVLISHAELRRRLDQRTETLFYRLDGSPFDAADFRNFLAEAVLENLGRPLKTAHVCDLISTKGYGIRDWKLDPNLRGLVAAANDRYRRAIECDLVNDVQIPRDEAQQLVDAILSPDSAGALLSAPGGYGKSCVLAQCLRKFDDAEVPYLCVRMDAVTPCDTASQLGRQLDLPGSPVRVLAEMADGGSCVLVVDQLDAVSLASGRMGATWDAFDDLRTAVRAVPGMKLLLACREFELEHDHRLRGLAGSKQSYRRVQLKRLDNEAVREAVRAAGLDDIGLKAGQVELLSVPLHLWLYLQGEPTKPFSTAGDLFDTYWERKRRNVEARLGRRPQFEDAIDSLTAHMSSSQTLEAPRVLLSHGLEDEANALVSEHVLVETYEGGRYRFFHQGFFDYAFARKFAVEGTGLVDFLVAGEQHLFRRAQVRQVLAYRRDHDFDAYLIDLRGLLGGERIRYHVRRMVASGLRTVERPTAAEWAVVCERWPESAARRGVGGPDRIVQRLRWRPLGLRDDRSFEPAGGGGVSRYGTMDGGPAARVVGGTHEAPGVPDVRTALADAGEDASARRAAGSA